MVTSIKMTARKVRNYNLRHTPRDKICHLDRDSIIGYVSLHDCVRRLAKSLVKTIQYERLCRNYGEYGL